MNQLHVQLQCCIPYIGIYRCKWKRSTTWSSKYFSSDWREQGFKSCPIQGLPPSMCKAYPLYPPCQGNLTLPGPSLAENRGKMQMPDIYLLHEEVMTLTTLIFTKQNFQLWLQYKTFEVLCIPVAG